MVVGALWDRESLFCLSLPASMLANAGFFPVIMAGVVMCNAVSWAALPLVFLPIVGIVRAVLTSLGYSASGDMAVLCTCTASFRLVGRFAVEPAPPVFPNLADALGMALCASDMRTRAS